MIDPQEEEEKQIETLIWKARFDPVWFVKEFLNVDPEQWQIELLEAIADCVRSKYGHPTVINHDAKNKITVRAGQGPGKTFGASLVAHWFGFCFRCKIPCTAPKERQLLTRLWPEFRKIARMAKPEYKAILDIQASKVVWFNDIDWMMIAETANTPENLAGYHDDYMIFICEESSGISEEMFPVVEGAVSTGKIVIVLLIGNPTQLSGTFYQSHCVNKVSKHYFQIHVSLDKSKRISRDWVKEMVDKYGEHSPVVQVRCYGEFPKASANQLLSLEWLTNSQYIEDETDGSIPKIRISVDVADGGEDDSVVTVAKHYQTFTQFLKQYVFNFEASVSIPKLVDAVYLIYTSIKEAEVFNSDMDVVVDSIGVGAGVAGGLLLNNVPVIRYKGGAASDDVKEWRNKRVQSYFTFKEQLRQGKIRYSSEFTTDFDDYNAQCCSILTKLDGERVDDLETKKEMLARGVKSPDKADSSAMQFATDEPEYISSGVISDSFGQMISSEYESYV